MALIAIALAALATAGCAHPEPKTEVLGVVQTEGNSTDVGLIDPVCITNTPTHDPC